MFYSQVLRRPAPALPPPRPARARSRAQPPPTPRAGAAPSADRHLPLCAPHATRRRRAPRRPPAPPPPQYVLAKKGPLGKIWLAAHMEKKVPKPEIMKTDIPESVKSIVTELEVEPVSRKP